MSPRERGIDASLAACLQAVKPDGHLSNTLFVAAIAPCKTRSYRHSQRICPRSTDSLAPCREANDREFATTARGAQCVTAPQSLARNEVLRSVFVRCRVESRG